MKAQSKAEKKLARIADYLMTCQISANTLGLTDLHDHYSRSRRLVLDAWLVLESARKKENFNRYGIAQAA